jgi:hypothetical protein
MSGGSGGSSPRASTDGALQGTVNVLITMGVRLGWESWQASGS